MRSRENYFAPPPTKIAEIEVKNRHEIVEKTKLKHLLCITSVIFRSNKVRSMLETHSTKATAVSKSNNAGVWVRSPQPPEANGGRGLIFRRCGDFIAFLFKKYAFLGIF